MKILIIDDLPDMRMVLRHSFEGFGFKITEAENGEEGLEALEKENFVFVLTDIQMPKMDGIEFLKKARAKFPDLPIFVMTGFSPYTADQVLSFGANGYFEKASSELPRTIARKFARMTA